MRITITCPSCRKKSQIDDLLKGKRLRCPYPDCRQPFRLSETGEAVSLDQPVVEQPKVVDWQATQGASPGRAWDVPGVADWQSAPPPQRGGESYEAAPPGWEGGGGYPGLPAEEASAYSASAGSYQAAPETDYYRPVKKKRAGLVMLILIGVSVVALAAGGLAYFKIKGQTEEAAKNKALKEYEGGHFAAAEKMFDKLAESFPDSKDVGLYRFMRTVSNLRATAKEGSPEQLDKAGEPLKKFYSDYRGKPLYKEHLQGVWQMGVEMANSGLAHTEKSADRAALEKANVFLETAKSIGADLPDSKVAEAKNAELDDRMSKANFAVAQAEARKAYLAELNELIAQGKPSGVETAQHEFVDLVRRYPKLEKDNEIKGKLDGFVRSEPTLIKFTIHDQRLSKPPVGTGDGASLLISPLVGARGAAAAAPENDPLVFSLARGILYAHAQSNGEVRWALRVGIDTHTLPIRMPARPPQPEIALVLSTDTTANTSTVIAIDTRSGEALVVPAGFGLSSGADRDGNVAYFPTTDGKVHEIEASEGRLRGIFDVGQPLTVPGSYDPTERRLFVPADRKRIYVLDVGERKRCAGVYYTNHTVGGLRAAPIITPSTLVIAEGNSLASMQIKSFTLSESGDTATPTPENYKVRGWSWHKPYFDGDTLGYLTDRGSLALFGLKRGTSDKALFLLGPQSDSDRGSGDLYGMPVGEQGGLEAVNQPPLGPAQVAHVDLNEWWLVVSGKLYRYRFDLYRQQLVRAPMQPLTLGMPLQDSQARGQHLILGTQALDRCLLTALDRQSGDIAWQRQLGLMTGQDPVVLGGHVVAIDKAGGLFELDAGKTTAVPKSATDRIPGPSAGNWLANGIPGLDPASPPRVVAAADGSFAVAVLHDASVDKVTLRRYEPGKGITAERTYRFESAPLALGTPALDGQSIIIPCRDGNLRELPLAGSNDLPVALSWRSREAGAGAVGHAVLLSDTQLVASDGFRKLQRWERTAGGDRRWRRTTNADLTFNGRIITPVVLVNSPHGERHICLGDDTGALYLVSPARNETVRQWRFPGRITRGPFVRGNHIGLVLDQSNLVWLDPQKDQQLWERPFNKLGIAGEPQLVGNLILVAENTGKYFWLDDAGAEKGRFESKASVVPAAAAVPLGPSHAFAPLSDGTAFLLTAPSSAGPAKAE